LAAYCAHETVRLFRADECRAPAIAQGVIAAGVSLAVVAVDDGLGTGSKPKKTR
jgi:Flp pilus assembly pilin Flp